ncbi:PIN domain-like protein [Boletus edulis BED1]|uniref:PIN domain-like protein n=1 Tax=Boletus edulis BED1 TaxID=1328754 RepID=A0AAD4BWH0_BOLED|nr:PIN domain-like protein [Boletus edulis BED1]
MGVRGLWPILACARDERSLTEFAANEGFQSGVGASGVKLLTVGVDASVWMHSVCPVFRYNHAGAGANPELRTLFYRLAALLKMLTVFGFAWHEGPGEAEAELAVLSQNGLIDAVLTTDNDALVFGATLEQPRHFDRVEIYTDYAVANAAGLSHGDLLLIALLSGGDYDLGDDLVHAFTTKGPETVDFNHFLCGWRNDLRRVLATDPEGYIGREHGVLANSIPASFPCPNVLRQYICPVTSFSAPAVDGPVAQTSIDHVINSRQPSLSTLALFCTSKFGWDTNVVIQKMHATVLEGTWLAKQPGDETRRLKPTVKLVHCRAVETASSRLVVFTVRLNTKQLADVVRASLSSPAARSGHESDDASMFVTIPACVIEHAFPAEAARFTHGDQRLSSSDAGMQARSRADMRAFLHAGFEGVGVSMAAQGSQPTVIDLTGGSDSELVEKDI